MLTSNNISTALRRLGACPEGAKWADTQPDAGTAWARCERADWMIWLLGRLAGPPHSPSRLALVACCADCAETAVHLIRDKGIRDRVRDGLALLRHYVHGDGDLYSARGALAAAAAAEAVAVADAASYAAANAAFAAYAAANAADAAADAAYAAANAADAAAYAAYAAAEDASLRALREMAAIVRQHYPTPPGV